MQTAGSLPGTAGGVTRRASIFDGSGPRGTPANKFGSTPTSRKPTTEDGGSATSDANLANNDGHSKKGSKTSTMEGKNTPKKAKAGKRRASKEKSVTPNATAAGAVTNTALNNSKKTQSTPAVNDTREVKRSSNVQFELSSKGSVTGREGESSATSKSSAKVDDVGRDKKTSNASDTTRPRSVSQTEGEDLLLSAMRASGLDEDNRPNSNRSSTVSMNSIKRANSTPQSGAGIRVWGEKIVDPETSDSFEVAGSHLSMMPLLPKSPYITALRARELTSNTGMSSDAFSKASSKMTSLRGGVSSMGMGAMRSQAMAERMGFGESSEIGEHINIIPPSTTNSQVVLSELQKTKSEPAKKYRDKWKEFERMGSSSIESSKDLRRSGSRRKSRDGSDAKDQKQSPGAKLEAPAARQFGANVSHKSLSRTGTTDSLDSRDRMMGEISDNNSNLNIFSPLDEKSDKLQKLKKREGDDNIL